MEIFSDYARYYDLLYRDKDYDGEVNYVDSLLTRFAPQANSVLELGSGTGKHGIGLAKKGYSITGVELSNEMYQQSLKRLEQEEAALKGKVAFLRGDIRDFQVGQTFDAVISLFHVVSYQVGNHDLRKTFDTVRKHTSSGGILIFDFWYGPAVLSLVPETRIKRLKDDSTSITRIAEPTMDYRNCCVNVNYTIFSEQKGSNAISKIQESHYMRYLFEPEIRIFLEEKGFELISMEEWMTGKTPGPDTWGVVVIARLSV